MLNAFAYSYCPYFSTSKTMSLQGIKCPKCLDSDLQGIRLAYAESVREVPNSNTDESFGPSLLADWFFGLLHGYVPLPGNSRSLLSERIHPPMKKSYARSIFWGALAGLCISLVRSGVERRDMWFLIIATIPLALIAWNTYKSVTEYNQTNWLEAYKKWESICMCKRCGQVVDPT